MLKPYQQTSFVALASMIFLMGTVGCGSGSTSSDESSSTPTNMSDPWLIQVPISQDKQGYVHLSVSVNGELFDCLFDTGAPGIWLPPTLTSHATVVVGNYERNNVSAYDLSDRMSWTGCLIGLPFFQGMSEYRIDLEAGVLEVR